MTFAAIDERRFYVVPHAKILDLVRQRMADIVDGRNPSGVFALTPEHAPPG
ncbi:MAG: hypothetical protein U5K74_14740 [Gemmatimonadaceae bacterium]|nr:hypothetical protein [Gemmatimonadaceae bacterium]